MKLWPQAPFHHLTLREANAVYKSWIEALLTFCHAAPISHCGMPEGVEAIEVAYVIKSDAIVVEGDWRLCVEAGHMDDIRQEIICTSMIYYDRRAIIDEGHWWSIAWRKEAFHGDIAWLDEHWRLLRSIGASKSSWRRALPFCLIISARWVIAIMI